MGGLSLRVRAAKKRKCTRTEGEGGLAQRVREKFSSERSEREKFLGFPARTEGGGFWASAYAYSLAFLKSVRVEWGSKIGRKTRSIDSSHQCALLMSFCHIVRSKQPSKRQSPEIFKKEITFRL